MIEEGDPSLGRNKSSYQDYIVPSFLSQVEYAHCWSWVWTNLIFASDTCLGFGAVLVPFIEDFLAQTLFFLALSLTSESFITERAQVDKIFSTAWKRPFHWIQGLLERSWLVGVLPLEILASYMFSQFLVIVIQVDQKTGTKTMRSDSHSFFHLTGGNSPCCGFWHFSNPLLWLSRPLQHPEPPSRWPSWLLANFNLVCWQIQNANKFFILCQHTNTNIARIANAVTITLYSKVTM